MQFLRDEEQLDIIGKKKQSQNLWKFEDGGRKKTDLFVNML